MELDNEVSGQGNSYTAEFWQYDSRTVRRWNVDPVVKHHESSYATFANNPIWFIDPSGADSTMYIGVNDEREKGIANKVAPLVERIYKKNGIDFLKVKIISVTDAKAMKNEFDVTDAYIEFRPGPDGIGGETQTGYYVDLGSFVDIYKYLKRYNSWNIDKANPLIAYATAHEFLHQYLNKSSHYFFNSYGFLSETVTSSYSINNPGDSRSVSVGNSGHVESFGFNLNFPGGSYKVSENISQDYTSQWPRSISASILTKPESILIFQKTAIVSFFKLHSQFETPYRTSGKTLTRDQTDLFRQEKIGIHFSLPWFQGMSIFWQSKQIKE